jgi:hypothetical protein
MGLTWPDFAVADSGICPGLAGFSRWSSRPEVRGLEPAPSACGAARGTQPRDDGHGLLANLEPRGGSMLRCAALWSSRSRWRRECSWASGAPAASARRGRRRLAHMRGWPAALGRRSRPAWGPGRGRLRRGSADLVEPRPPSFGFEERRPRSIGNASRSTGRCDASTSFQLPPKEDGPPPAIC